MNVLGVCLVYASLVSAGFWSQSTKKHEWKEDVTLKAGQAGVVIELEKDDGNTKVSVSPQSGVGEKGYVENAKEKLSETKEKIKEASSHVLPDVMRKGDSGHQEEEIINNDRIESYTGKAKEAAETMAANKVYEVEEEAKEAVREAVSKVKDTVAHTAHRVSDKADETKENVKYVASEVLSKAKEKVAEKASEMKQGAEEKARGKAKETEKLVESMSDRAKQRAHQAKNEVKKGIIWPARGMTSFAGVLHLLGFAVAYGMCVWVTFASNYVLARALPRHQFAMVQSKIYPVYFKAMACSVGTALLAHMIGQGMFRGLSLMMSLMMILVNLLYLEPRATKMMCERIKKEKEEGRGKEGDSTIPSSGATMTGTAAGRGTASDETASHQGQKQEEAATTTTKPRNITSSETLLLRRLNSHSSLLNVATLVSLTWHLVHLGKHLHAVC